MPMKSKSSTTTKKRAARKSLPKLVPPIHPGEVLLEEFLRPLQISQYRLALATRVPARRINEIVHGMRGVSADTALRLGIFFGTTPEFWMNLQAHYDLERAKDEAEARIAREVKPFSHVA